MDLKSKIILIYGPTASGKSEVLQLNLQKKLMEKLLMQIVCKFIKSLKFYQLDQIQKNIRK